MKLKGYACTHFKEYKNRGPRYDWGLLKENGISYKIIELADEKIEDAEKFDALIMMGGPMSVNDSDIYTYISREEELTREFIKKNKRSSAYASALR